MSYTDKEMMYATQVAYLDINPAAIEAHPDWTIKDHIENSDELKAFIAREQPHMMDAYMNGECGTWKVVDAQNNNDSNGFCGCLIDTGDGSAIIGYRGSESTNLEIGIDDWVVADVGLLNEDLTSQQQSAADYMSYIEKNYGDDYGKFSVTGHSLGGNLASHATLTASDEMAAKFDRVLNLDGPGCSEEYMAAHAKEIEKNAHLIDHYHYSWVGGGMLKEIPGSNYFCIDAQNDPDHPLAGILYRHGTWNITFDGDNFVPGTPDLLATWAKGFTNAADKNSFLPGIWALPSLISNIITNPKFGYDMITNTLEFIYDKIQDQIETAKKRYAESRMADFEIRTELLSESGSTLKQSSGQMNSQSNDVSNVSSQISLLLKAASLFTLSYKLKKSASNLEKLSAKAQKMGECADSIVTEVSNAENTIKAN